MRKRTISRIIHGDASFGHFNAKWDKDDAAAKGEFDNAAREAFAGALPPFRPSTEKLTNIDSDLEGESVSATLQRLSLLRSKLRRLDWQPEEGETAG